MCSAGRSCASLCSRIASSNPCCPHASTSRAVAALYASLSAGLSAMNLRFRSSMKSSTVSWALPLDCSVMSVTRRSSLMKASTSSRSFHVDLALTTFCACSSVSSSCTAARCAFSSCLRFSRASSFSSASLRCSCCIKSSKAPSLCFSSPSRARYLGSSLMRALTSLHRDLLVRSGVSCSSSTKALRLSARAALSLSFSFFSRPTT
mmetsp:Transcript_39509/g.97166  ORF Transcript_39509/g.97166 Transcript_39509/m.97166 type:complete len:206 (-) Transcript_39509:938-1555(-)